VPLKVLLEVGGWDVTRISEDSRIFWQCYIHYDGDYFVVPLPTTVSMDAVQTSTWSNTLANLYKQKRRWAYGAENLPLVGTRMLGKNHIKAPLGTRLAQVGRMLEASYSLGTAAVVLAVGGWLPSLLGGPLFRDTVLGQNFLNVTRFLLTLALIGVIFSIGVSARMLPKRPQDVPRRRVVNYWIQWLFAPFATILFGSIPAIDAHSRLLFGKYMEFQVMPKVRTKEQPDS
jgi:cellulose synthase/poly-beta-1,6-N-acetylglucosamine synthase-like glycosyltransferase